MWHLNPSSHLDTTDYGPKIGGCVPLGEGELVLHLAQCGQGRGLLHAKFHNDPSNRLATYTNVTNRQRQDRQDNGLIA